MPKPTNTSKTDGTVSEDSLSAVINIHGPEKKKDPQIDAMQTKVDSVCAMVVRCSTFVDGVTLAHWQFKAPM